MVTPRHHWDDMAVDATGEERPRWDWVHGSRREQIVFAANFHDLRADVSGGQPWPSPPFGPATTALCE
jgi:hypothetical protein